MTLLEALGAAHRGTLVTAHGRFSLADVLDAASDIASATSSLSGPQVVWIAAARPERVLAALAALAPRHRCFLVEPSLKEGEYRSLSSSAQPDLVVTDDASPAGASPVAAWAAGRGLPTLSGARGPGGALGRPTASRPQPAQAGVGFFTSGTTGLPKPVVHHEAGVLAAATGVAGLLALTPEDVSLSLSPASHTLGLVTTLLAPLLTGGTALAVSPHDVAPLAALTRRHPPTWCAAPPALLAYLHRLRTERSLALPELRLLRSSAAPLRPALQTRLAESFGVPLINAYAMTEAPGEIASQRLPPAFHPPGSLGRPSLCEVQVRDLADGRPRRSGPGELWVRGPTVTPAAAGWLRTGDLGSLAEDGELRMLGRLDEVINRGGELVSPYEVETAAEEHHGVAEAVAFPIPDASLGERLGLAVVPRGKGLERGELRRFLLDRLSLAKVPQTITLVERIPTTRRGKIARRGLHAALSGQVAPANSSGAAGAVGAAGAAGDTSALR